MTQQIRIATFNTNSVRTRLPILERWLQQSKTDVLFLQETKVQDSDFPQEVFDAIGYRTFFCGEKSYNGVALIAKQSLPVPEVSFGFGDGDEPPFSTRVLLARWNNFSVLNTYVPQGKSIEHPDYLVKQAFLRRVRKLVEAEMSRPFAWLGDLNVAPTEEDVTNPKNKKDHVCFHQDIRALFAQTTTGLTDLLRQFHPESNTFTFFDYRVKNALERNIGWRIDHILATPSLAEMATDCFVDKEPRGWEKPSDHTPLIADFTLASA